jgi:phosphonate transport system permease protein
MRNHLPPRWERPRPFALTAWILVALFLASAIHGTEVSVVKFVDGLPRLGNFLARAVPPDLSSFDRVLAALFETFQMAVVGTTLGILLAIPVAICATANLSPHPTLYYGARGLISFARTIPDLIWGLIFVVMVGLGPFAGTLALAVDTLGFCGRFFAEAMEDVDDGPQEALKALGASRSGIIASAVIPAALPSFVTTGLFSLELATRSSVVLGIVGAGGIGMELKVAMDLFRYDEALTILLAIFLLVLAVERTGAAIRRRVIGREVAVAHGVARAESPMR